MTCRSTRTRAGQSIRARKGVATIELALTLPMLCFILVASADFARAFHDYVAVTDCARNGALFASRNPSLSASACQAGISAAVLADSSNLAGTPTVSSTSGSLGAGNTYVNVTVSSPFQTLTPYPGIPYQITLSRTIRMRVQPSTYRMN